MITVTLRTGPGSFDDVDIANLQKSVYPVLQFPEDCLTLLMQLLSSICRYVSLLLKCGSDIKTGSVTVHSVLL